MEEIKVKQNLTLDSKKFSRGIKKLYQTWSDLEIECDAMLILKGNDAEDVIEPKSSAFQ